MEVLRRVGSWLLPGLLACLVSCGDTVTKFPFQDERGRSCVRTCTDERCGDDCDSVPDPTGGCDGGEPCWTVADGFPNDAGLPLLALCDSCCARRGSVVQSTWRWEDCSRIVCEVARDCVVGAYRCEGRYCVPEE